MDLELHLNGIEAHIEPAAVEGMSEQPAVPIAIPYLELRTAGRGDHEVKVGACATFMPRGAAWSGVCLCTRAYVWTCGRCMRACACVCAGDLEGGATGRTGRGAQGGWTNDL